MVASKVYFCFHQTESHRLKVNFSHIVRQRLEIMENLVYTIPKINPMFVENDGSAVNNMIIFNLQNTRR